MKTLGVVAAIIVAIVAWFKLSYPSATVHYRLTVDVETPEGLKSGSGVIAITFGLLTGVIEQSFHSSSRGEAIFIDLGTRGTLYALLSSKTAGGSDAPFFRFREAFGLEKAMGPHKATSVQAFANARGTRSLQAKQLPIFVKFRDDKDPKTVEEVDANNLAASFGPGVALRRVIIETTNEPVTAELHKRLVWLSSFPEPSLAAHPPSSNPPLAARLYHGDFRRNQ